MKKSFAVLLAAALTLTCLGGAFSASAEGTAAARYTYTLNFEQGTAADYFVDSNADRNAKYSLETVTGRDGKETTAVKINGSVNSAVTANLNQNIVGLKPNPEQDKYFSGAAVTAGKTYKYSAWGKLDADTVTAQPTAQLVYSYFKDEAKTQLEFKTIEKTYGNTYNFSSMLYNDNKGLWTKLVAYFTVSSASESQNIGLSLYFGTSLNGVAWLDDVQLEELSGGVVEFTAPQTVQTITFDDERPYSFNRSRFEIVPNAGVSGSAALMLRSGSYSNTSIINQPTTLNNQTDLALAVPVNSGRQYVLSAKVYVAADAADLTYACLYANYKAENNATVTSATQEFHKLLNQNKGQWVQVSVPFKPEFTNSSEIRKVGITANFGKDVAADVYLDDLTLTDVTAAAEGAFGNSTTVQIRKQAGEVSQALRFKVTLNRNTLNSLPGFELAEYGCLTTLQNNIDSFGVNPQYFAEGNSTTVTGSDEKPKRVYIGRAFVKSTGTDLIFDENEDGSIVYTAALTNIGLKSDKISMNYNVWGAEYYVLPYAVLKNTATGETTVYYGEKDAGSESVFGVMQQIQSGNNESDKAYVAEKLANEDIKTAYDSYISKVNG